MFLTLELMKFYVLCSYKNRVDHYNVQEIKSWIHTFIRTNKTQTKTGQNLSFVFLFL